MADFCHDFDPGGLGGYHPLGDFSWALEKWGSKLKVDEFVRLGLCEGHGCGVALERHEDGLTLVHYEFSDFPLTDGEEVPPPKKIPESFTVTPEVILEVEIQNFTQQMLFQQISEGHFDENLDHVLKVADKFERYEVVEAVHSRQEKIQ